MGKFFETVTDLGADSNRIRNRRYGVIEVAEARLVGIHLRPWPKLISATEAKWLGGWQHGRRRRDQCLLYYNQPLGHQNFLALKYTVTSFGTSWKTFWRTLVVLDKVAAIKRIDAIVADVTNDRMSDRFMRRMGWEEHLPDQPGRHFIKRFYGEYPNHVGEFGNVETGRTTATNRIVTS